MAKKPTLAADLATISLFAPLIVHSRLQMLAGEAFMPTRRGQREVLKMATEKPLAFVEAGLAMQKSFFESGLKIWADMATGSSASFFAAPGLSLEAAMVPVRKRVHRNARRLGRR